MTKYLEPSFSTFAVGSDEYRANHERIFGKKREDVEPTPGAVVETPSAGSRDQPSLIAALELAEPCLADQTQWYPSSRNKEALTAVRTALAGHHLKPLP